jgi:hypothetical protein
MAATVTGAKEWQLLALELTYQFKTMAALSLELTYHLSQWQHMSLELTN